PTRPASSTWVNSSSSARRARSSRTRARNAPRTMSPGGSADGHQARGRSWCGDRALEVRLMRQFHQELETVRTRVLEMADLARRNVLEGVDALLELDMQKARAVVER